MLAYATPGVYHSLGDAAAPGIAALRTDIAGFVGIASRGPLHSPVAVQSWRQFQACFGGFSGAGYLAYAVRAFFENGGAKCWVVRVASELAAAAAADIPCLSPAPRADLWRIAASSPGAFGNGLDITLRETHAAQTWTVPRGSTAEAAQVLSVAGFGRASHVRLSQDGKPAAWKVVAGVDAAGHRLFWVHPDAPARLPYDAPLAGFDADRPILLESVEYTLLVREAGRIVAAYGQLSLVPEHLQYGPAVLPALSPMGVDVLPQGVGLEPVSILPLLDMAAWLARGLPPLAAWDAASAQALPLAADYGLTLAGGADGLAQLAVADFIGEDFSVLDSDAVKQRKRRGLRALQEIGEVAMLAVPDIHIQPTPPPLQSKPPACVPDPCLPPPPAVAAPRSLETGDLPPLFSEHDIFQVQAAMVAQCEALRDRIALLDPPYAAARNDALGFSAAQAWRRRFDSSYAAFYYPWLNVANPQAPVGLTRAVPPSGHVAGQYAHTDLHVGVHKAPANAALVWAQDTSASLDDAQHGLLNPQGINAIRALPGRGLRILGARTLASDAGLRFVNVRRLLMLIAKAITLSTQWAVFEPNDPLTRAKLRLSLTSYLMALWQQGALQGASPEQAFFVRCDEDNNPEPVRGLGQLRADVGVAPSQPFEFVVLRVGRADNEFAVNEAGQTGGGF